MENNESNKLDLYINKLIGTVNYSNFSDCDINYLSKIEQARKTHAKKTVDALLLGLPKEHLMYEYNKDTRGLTDFSDIDILDIEVMLNSAVLTVLKLTKNKNKQSLRHYRDRILCSESANRYVYNHKIIYTADIYDREINKLIKEKEELIAKLLETNQPTFDLFEAKEEPKTYKLNYN